LSQHLALELLRRGFLEEFLPALREQYGLRRDAMLEALEKYFPKGATWTTPEGGFFLWVTLPKHINAGQLLPAALAQHVAFVPGEEFHLHGEGKNTMRLNFTNASPARIEEGIKKLGRLL
jgi:2-aminoadipate transaminase